MRAVATLFALTLAATSGQAAAPFTYKFAGPLKYRTVLLSEGSFTLPDGRPSTMKLEAVSTVQLTPKGTTPQGTELASETLRTRTLMDDREVPPPPGLQTRRTLKVAPTGAVDGGPDQTFAVVFPPTPLARGDAFTEERKSGPEGLPLKTTWTVAEAQATLSGYPAPVAVLEAKSTLATVPKDRKVTLKEAGGKLWFDAAAGVLVRTQLAYTFLEESNEPGTPARRTQIRYTSELIK